MNVIFGIFLMVISNILQYRAGMIQNHFWSFISLICFILGVGFVVFGLYSEIVSIKKTIAKTNSLLDRAIELNEEILSNDSKLNSHCADITQLNRRLLESLDKSLKLLKEEGE